MQRVTGVGGIFFRASDPEALRAWYKLHLGVGLEPWGGSVFSWNGPENPTGTGSTVWSVVAQESSKFAKTRSSFMVNYLYAGSVGGGSEGRSGTRWDGVDPRAVGGVEGLAWTMREGAARYAGGPSRVLAEQDPVFEYSGI